MLSLILISSIVVISYLYYLMIRNLDYWEKKNIPYLKPLPLVGNYGPYIFSKKYIGEMVQSFCLECPSIPYFGVYFGKNPTLVVQDPELLRHVFTKDFHYFSGRENSEFTHNETFLASLFFISGDVWKTVRQQITPLFSSSKLKSMFDIMKTSIYSFERLLQEEITSNQTVKVRNLILRFTLNASSNSIFGVETKTMEKNIENNPYIKMSTEMFEISTKKTWRIIGRSIYPNVFYSLGFTDVPIGVENFFRNFIKELNKGSSDAKSRGFIDILNNVNSTDKVSKELKTEISENANKNVGGGILSLAQCMTIFGASFESSATTISYTLYEISKYPEVQDRVDHEIDEYLRRHDNVLDVDCVKELPYVVACIDEALRLYPVVGIIRREVSHSYTLPCGTVLDKGVRIHIPVYHLHRSPQYFPDPKEFKPERFLFENRENIKPFTYLPFGEGPRMCMGSRYAKMQILPALVTILKQYRLKLAQGMPFTLKLVPVSLITQPVEDITLEFVEREGWQKRQFSK